MKEATSELGLGGWIRLQKLMRGGKGMSKHREARKQGTPGTQVVWCQSSEC